MDLIELRKMINQNLDSLKISLGLKKVEPEVIEEVKVEEEIIKKEVLAEVVEEEVVTEEPIKDADVRIAALEEQVNQLTSDMKDILDAIGMMSNESKEFKKEVETLSVELKAIGSEPIVKEVKIVETKEESLLEKRIKVIENNKKNKK